jgi:CRISPR-associated endonuclease/helicase Cas3
VLVEQSEREARKWLTNLNLQEDIPVHLLMGGADTEEWYLYPEKPAVLIGTQDMLLSRALNRGYAASRFHWPIDFGLLNNDCLWVFDEPQLMASGVSTSAQVAGQRQALRTFGACPSVWMSATLEPNWLDTIDFRGKCPGHPLELDDRDYDPNLPLFHRMTADKTLHPLGVTASKDMKEVAKKALEKHVPGTQTLIVVNTVERAKAVYHAVLKERKKAETPKLLLIHSRFRGYERVGEKDENGNVLRVGLNDQLRATGETTKDRIVVATQVVEAGVDISARTLITELCPWASIVQRIGRCNRTGVDGPGQVFWIDNPARDADKKEDKSAALPYPVADLVFARRHLEQLEGGLVSPKALEEYKQANEKPDDPFLKFEHRHILRRRDLVDLFDTAPDLSGNDIDIARFVRSDDPDTDVQVFWRAEAPSNDWGAAERRRQQTRRSELCNVPIGSFKKDFLEAGKTAYRFDHLEGEWQQITKKDKESVVPGQTFWVEADQGGYDQQLGWLPEAGPLRESLLVPLPVEPPTSGRARPEGFYDSDEWAYQREWRTIAQHTDEVVAALEAILAPLAALRLSEDERKALQVAARWHDWGKRHAVFQSGLREEIDDPKELSANAKRSPGERTRLKRPEGWRNCPEVAKAPKEFWQKYRRVLPENRRPVAKRFRHELASALGVLALYREGRLPTDWAALSESDRWLRLGPFHLAYLEALLRAADCRASGGNEAGGSNA